MVTFQWWIWQDLSVMTATIATSKQTVEALLDRSARPNRALPIRTTFVQGKDTKGRAAGPGPLATFVANGDETGLDLNLLVRSVASGDGEFGYSVRQASKVWSRALHHCRSNISSPGISKASARLEQRKLITRSRSQRMASITILREDGSGQPYTHPSSDPKPRQGPSYFQLPYEYWLEDWSNELTLPGKAMLLVALSLPDDFPLPVERTPAWYGWSADTALRGFHELVNNKILARRREPTIAPLAPDGFTLENRYTVLPPFDRIRPKNQQAKT